MRNYLTTAKQETGLKSRDFDFERFVEQDYNNHHHPRGKDIFKRTHGFSKWVDSLKSTNLFLYSRRTLSAPGPECYG